MSEPKFTPGPWQWSMVSGDYRTLVNEELDTIIDSAGTEDMWLCSENIDANASLIAAAPELFELLKEALEDWDETNFDEEYPYRIDWADKARAALAKARGE